MLTYVEEIQAINISKIDNIKTTANTDHNTEPFIEVPLFYLQIHGQDFESSNYAWHKYE